MPLNEPRIKDPNPKRTADNWAYIEANKKKEKERDAASKKRSK
jgi:hypothetical protein